MDLKPGRELDQLVYEHVMGSPPDRQPGTGLWEPSTKIRDAWEVLAEFKRGGRHGRFSMRHLFLEALARVINSDLAADDDLHPTWHLLFLEPHHICQAALKALERS